MKTTTLVLLTLAFVGGVGCGGSDAKTGDASAVIADGGAVDGGSKDTGSASADGATKDGGSVVSADTAASGDGGAPDAPALPDAPVVPNGDAARDGAVVTADAAPDTRLADAGVAADTGTNVAFVCPLPGALAAPACNALVNTGTDVALVAEATAIPVGTGGTIVDGRYHLSAFKSYQGSTAGLPVSMRQTLDICGTLTQFTGDQPGQPTQHNNTTITTAGIVPTTVDTCKSKVGDTAIIYSSYTATATSVTLYASLYKFSVTFTK